MIALSCFFIQLYVDLCVTCVVVWVCAVVIVISYSSGSNLPVQLHNSFMYIDLYSCRLSHMHDLLLSNSRG